MTSRRFPVAVQCVLVYLACAALLSTAFIHRLVSNQSDQLVAEVAKKGDAVSRLFARSITTALFHLDVHLMENQISHVKSLQDVGEVTVFNERGQCVTDGTAANPRLGDVLAGAQELVARAAKAPEKHEQPGQLRYGMIVQLGDRIIGGVLLEFSLTSVIARVRDLRGWLIALAAVLTVLGALPVWLVAQYFLKPLLFGDE